jgi:hypothetical protein
VCSSPQRNSLNLILKSPSSPPSTNNINYNTNNVRNCKPSNYTKRPLSQDTIMEHSTYLVGLQQQQQQQSQQQQHQQHLNYSIPSSPEFLLTTTNRTEFNLSSNALTVELENANNKIIVLQNQLDSSVSVVVVYFILFFVVVSLLIINSIIYEISF